MTALLVVETAVEKRAAVGNEMKWLVKVWAFLTSTLETIRILS